MRFWIVFSLVLVLASPAFGVQSTFVASWMPEGYPDLPQFSDNATMLTYRDEKGMLHGGFVVVSYAPDDTVIVLIDTSQATRDWMKTQTSRWIWIEDLDQNGTVEPLSFLDWLFPSAWAASDKKTDDKPAITDASLSKDQIKAMKVVLKADSKTAKKAELERGKLEKQSDVKPAMLNWHNLTEAQYKGAMIGGK